MNWLLLRGLAREQTHWGVFPSRLQSAFPGSRIRFLDLPGTGTEFNRDSPLTVGAIAADLRERWLTSAERDPEDTWGIIGISLGGMVAMDWCREHPSDFSRLILINASAGNLSFPFERIRPLMVTRGIPSLFSADPLARETRILRMTTRLKQAEIATLALDWAKLAQARPIRTRTVISQLLAAALFRAPRAFTIPVLIASSAADRFTSPRCSQSLAHRFGASLVTHPQAGHDLPLDDPDWLSQQVRQWCDLSPAAHHNQTDS